jgi:hypothetical protein
MSEENRKIAIKILTDSHEDWIYKANLRDSRQISLDAIDQLKATGLLDAAKDVEDFLQSDDMGRQWRDEVLVKLREATVKLNALLGEPLEGPKDGRE